MDMNMRASLSKVGGSGGVEGRVGLGSQGSYKNACVKTPYTKVCFDSYLGMGEGARCQRREKREKWT
jgi:hypothetical protein